MNRIVEYIVYITDPEEILLFGSVASGRHDVHSDIDLLIISERVDQHRQRKEEIKGFVARFGFQADVILLTKHELSTEINNSTGFLSNALKMSKKIYKK